jgi:prepilin-type N-terminal cleavage/methylation domain-containing protein
MSKGFTLIEVLIYLALFTIVIGGGMVATYQIIQSADAGNNHIIMEEEANFLLRKINWALTGWTVPSDITVTSSSLTINKSGGQVFTYDSTNGILNLNSVPLNSSNTKVTALTFTNSPSNSITAAFTLTTVQNGKNVTENFSTTKYLR